MENFDLSEPFAKRQACYFVSPTILDDKGDLLVCIAILNEPTFIQSNETLGKSLEKAAEIVRRRNIKLGISEKRAMDIVHSSINLDDEIENLIKDTENG